MAEKAKRSSRFDVISRLFMGYKSGNQTIEVVQKNLEVLGYFVTEKELPKFAEENPDLNIDEVKEFLVAIGGFKEGKKKASTAKGEPRTSLNTVEGAIARGVAPENIPAYIEAVNIIYAQSKIINEFATLAHASFAIPLNKVKEEVAPEVSAVSEG